MNLGITVEGQAPAKWYGIAEFSTRKATAETISTVNVSQILATEESRVGTVNASQALVGARSPSYR